VKTRRILVVDGNTPWVRSLFMAMPEGVRVAMVRPYHPRMFRAALGASPLWSGNSRRQLRGDVWEEHAVIAGWTRFGRLSEQILRRRCARAVRLMGGCDAAVFVIPQYAGLAESFHGAPRVYYAYDPYEFYDWNITATRAGEDRMLRTCELSVAISKKLTEDFRPRTSGRLVYSPNAVSEAFVAAMQASPQPPSDLSALSGPIVGCTGQINSSYDWDLIDAVADRLRSITFVFVGNLQEPSLAVRKRIEATFARENVRWLGPRNHAALPSYIANFNVCLNPLAVTPHNDRRSPLRLYDYLASHQPVVSTAVAEAAVHDGLIAVGHTPEEIASHIEDALKPGHRVDLPARQSYISNNTWAARARRFLKELEALETPRRDRL
jgi:glycosyltransferase involved in cell wall biosynthesis